MVHFIDHVMRETAKSLGRSLDSYWPTRVSNTCELPERNLSLHCSVVLANMGFSVLQELSFPGQPKAERLDVLAIAPAHSFALHLEVKQYWSGSMINSLADLERVKRFSVDRSLDPVIFGRSFVDPINSLGCEVGVVAGTLWRSTRQGTDLTGEAQETFVSHVQAMDGVICQEPHLIRRYTPEGNSSWNGAFYLYWALVGDWRRKVSADGKLI
ncbi:hypothetical protein KOM00_01935 [Geomonas sp. Red69]|uniref:hypothetical protein n=1 Tax=Geomonas diazotrophica TaxID=2843197 RepID=UPI001C1099CB|nr:hypothetical protein [Geomonas diazotrophica]MBU5635486.1 hypothetical protein [Geomonas diazotrophica]